MAKKILTALLCVCLLAGMPMVASASTGWDEDGWYTDTTPQFVMLTEESVFVYNKEIYEGPDYDEMWTGGALMIPLGIFDSRNPRGARDNYATNKQVKESNVEVSYNVSRGSRYVQSVEIVNGKKEKVDGLLSTMYVKVQFVDDFTSTSYVDIRMNLVLMVNKVSYQNSRATLDCKLRNWEEWIDRNSVYGAQVPTKYKVMRDYDDEVTFDMGDGITYTAKVAANARYSINLSQNPDYDMEYMYPDAYMEFYNFLGDNDTFDSRGVLSIPITPKLFTNKSAGAPRVYAYEILENRQLLALGTGTASYDTRANVLTIRTNTLGNYVLSNTKLLQEVEEQQDNTFQSGYATWEDFIEDDEDATQVESSTGNRTGTSTGGGVVLGNPTTGGDDLPDVAAQSDGPEVAQEVERTSDPAPDINTQRRNAAVIKANNPGELFNPETGPAPSRAWIALPVLSGLLCAALWSTRPFRKRD